MPEAIAAPVVPTPKPVVVTTAPVVPTPPIVAAPDPEAKYKALETDFQRKSREAITERRKAESLARESAAVKAELATLRKRDEAARLNPPQFLQELYGEKWHEMINEAKLNGTSPAALVQQEIAKVREENDAKWKARDDAEATAREAAKTEGVEQARRSIFADAASFYRAKTAEYPLLAKLGGEPKVAAVLAQRIEAEFHAQGKILTVAEVADLVEGEVLEWAREAGKHEKYKTKLQPPAASPTVVPSKPQQGQQQPSQVRRSLTNNITGSTSPVTPPLSAKDRRERVLAAYEAHRKKD